MIGGFDSNTSSHCHGVCRRWGAVRENLQCWPFQRGRGIIPLGLDFCAMKKQELVLHPELDVGVGF